MRTWKTPAAAFAALVQCVVVLPNVGAADKVDLERVKPVPADQPVPIGDYFRPSLFRNPSLNPSGTHIAALVSAANDKYSLLTYELATQKLEPLAMPGDTDIYQYHWLNDKRLVFSLSTRKMYGLGLYAAEVGSMNRAYPLLQYYGARFISAPRRERLRPLVWASNDSSTGKDIGVVVLNTDIRTGRIVNLVKAGSDWSDFADARDDNERHIRESYPLPRGALGTGYVADKMGELAFAFMADDGIPSLHRWTGKTWEKCPIDLDKTEFVGVGNEPGQIVVLTEREEGKTRALRFMDAATGTLGALLLQDPAYDFNGWLYRDPTSRDIVGAVYERNGPHVVWFNEGYAALQKLLDGYFPGLVVRLLGSDEAGKVFLVSTFSDRQPEIFHWVNLEKKSFGLVKNSRPWIDPQRMQPMNTMKFKTRDGKTLDAYLTLPAGASKQNPPPLVVLAHGGPWARDSWGFDGEVQFLASRGYAVLQPNYRGSTGYGWMFPEEDEWAFRKMHDDVTDAVRAVAKSGYVDKTRIAIAGGSFGGYLALSGVANEPEMYRCAVAIAGVFDWATMLKDAKYSQYDNPMYARLKRKLGDPAKQAEKFAEISPLRRVNQVRVPVFVSHGKDDPVVAVGESKRLISELSRHNVPHESLLVGEEGHGMGYLKNRVELYERVEAFLAKHMGASSAAPKPAN